MAAFVTLLCFSIFSACACAVSGGGGSLSFNAPQLFPESFDWDAAHSRFIVGSTVSGCLTAVAEDGGLVQDFLCDQEYAGKAAVLGVKVDAKRNRVLAVVNDMGEQRPPFHAVAAYDLDTKERLLFVLLHTVGIEQGEKSVANDVAADDEGNLYITNTLANFIWKVDTKGEASVFVRSSLFTSQPVIVNGFLQPLGLNGIDYHKHGFLVVGQSNSGSLFKVELRDQHTSVMATDKLLPAADCVRFRDEQHLVVVSTDAAWILSTKTDWNSALVLDRVDLNSSAFTTAVAFRDSRTFLLCSFVSDLWRGLTRHEFSIQEIEFPSERDNSPVTLILVLLLMVGAIVGWRWHMNRFLRSYSKRHEYKIDKKA